MKILRSFLSFCLVLFVFQLSAAEYDQGSTKKFPEYVRALTSPSYWVLDSDHACAQLDINKCEQEQMKLQYHVASYFPEDASIETFSAEIIPLLKEHVFGHIWALEPREFDIFDAPIGSTARTLLKESYQWVEENYLSKPLRDLTVDELEKFINKFNYLALNTEQYSNNNYKQKAVSFPFRQTAGFVWDLSVTVHQEDDVPAFLASNYPELLPVWDNLLARFSATTVLEVLFASVNSGNELTSEELNTLDKLGYIMPSPQKVPQLMKRFVKALKKRLSKPDYNPINTAAWAHHQLVKIHPFWDKNGTTARMLMNVILMQSQLPPVAFISDFEYSNALKYSNCTQFTKLLKQKVDNLVEQEELEHQLGFVDLEDTSEAVLLLHAEDYYHTEEGRSILEKSLRDLVESKRISN